MRKLLLLASAEDDLISIYKYIARESRNIEIAKNFIEKLYHKCEELAA